jgi:hypothetical protein
MDFEVGLAKGKGRVTNAKKRGVVGDIIGCVSPVPMSECGSGKTAAGYTAVSD